MNFLQMEPNGDCLFESILQQINHPEQNTAQMICHQAALHMLKNPHMFYQYMEDVLDGESYLNYCKNLFHGRIWGCDMVTSTVG